MGNAYSLFKELFPGQPRWSVDQVPDLTGQVIIVTGSAAEYDCYRGNAGIGRETCKVLLGKGAKVYMAARNRSKADEAIEWLKTETNGKIPIFLQLDLADLDSVRRAAEEFKQKEQELHVLFNNGGVMNPPIDIKTANGYDSQFGTNMLGHYLFTMSLLTVLIHTAQTCGHARVVNTSSASHWLAPKGGIDYATLVPNDVQSDESRKKLGVEGLYAQSKWGNIAFANELAQRYRSQGIISTSVHPGGIWSELQRHMRPSSIETLLLGLIMWPTPYGAITQLYAGTTPEGLELSGQASTEYLTSWARVTSSRADTRDEQAGKELWEWLEEQVKRN
ncbi:NAD(P)-binding protein [Ceratobasidium sp. AG-I]|nr:NAD(P)-binding protein [Ceratobasidium sp. AG-I]